MLNCAQKQAQQKYNNLMIQVIKYTCNTQFQLASQNYDLNK